MARVSVATRLAVLTALLALLVAGCTSSDAAGPATTKINHRPSATPVSKDEVSALDDLLVRESEQPAYSAKVRLRTLVDGQLGAVVTGKTNLNAKTATGHFRFRTLASGDTPASTVETVRTVRADYARKLQKNSKNSSWQKVRRTEAPVANVTGFARLLLKRGPSAVKGPEALDWIQTTRLSGKITAKDVRELEPSLYRRLQANGLKSLTCDLWVDGSGRVVRFEERFSLQGYPVRNVMELSAFGAPFKQKKPKVIERPSTAAKL